MQGLGGIFLLLYICCIIGVTIFVLALLSQFVRAHERIANALEIVSRKLRDDGKG